MESMNLHPTDLVDNYLKQQQDAELIASAKLDRNKRQQKPATTMNPRSNTNTNGNNRTQMYTKPPEAIKHLRRALVEDVLKPDKLRMKPTYAFHDHAEARSEAIAEESKQFSSYDVTLTKNDGMQLRWPEESSAITFKFAPVREEQAALSQQIVSMKSNGPLNPEDLQYFEYYERNNPKYLLQEPVPYLDEKSRPAMPWKGSGKGFATSPIASSRPLSSRKTPEIILPLPASRPTSAAIGVVKLLDAGTTEGKLSPSASKLTSGKNPKELSVKLYPTTPPSSRLSGKLGTTSSFPNGSDIDALTDERTHDVSQQQSSKDTVSAITLPSIKLSTPNNSQKLQYLLPISSEQTNSRGIAQVGNESVPAKGTLVSDLHELSALSNATGFVSSPESGIICESKEEVTRKPYAPSYSVTAALRQELVRARDQELAIQQKRGVQRSHSRGRSHGRPVSAVPMTILPHTAASNQSSIQVKSGSKANEQTNLQMLRTKQRPQSSQPAASPTKPIYSHRSLATENGRYRVRVRNSDCGVRPGNIKIPPFLAEYKAERERLKKERSLQENQRRQRQAQGSKSPTPEKAPTCEIDVQDDLSSVFDALDAFDIEELESKWAADMDESFFVEDVSQTKISESAGVLYSPKLKLSGADFKSIRWSDDYEHGATTQDKSKSESQEYDNEIPGQAEQVTASSEAANPTTIINGSINDNISTDWSGAAGTFEASNADVFNLSNQQDSNFDVTSFVGSEKQSVSETSSAGLPKSDTVGGELQEPESNAQSNREISAVVDHPFVQEPLTDHLHKFRTMKKVGLPAPLITMKMNTAGCKPDEIEAVLNDRIYVPANEPSDADKSTVDEQAKGITERTSNIHSSLGSATMIRLGSSGSFDDLLATGKNNLRATPAKTGNSIGTDVILDVNPGQNNYDDDTFDDDAMDAGPTQAGKEKLMLTKSSMNLDGHTFHAEETYERELKAKLDAWKDISDYVKEIRAEILPERIVSFGSRLGRGKFAAVYAGVLKSNTLTDEDAKKLIPLPNSGGTRKGSTNSIPEVQLLSAGPPSAPKSAGILPTFSTDINEGLYQESFPSESSARKPVALKIAQFVGNMNVAMDKFGPRAEDNQNSSLAPNSVSSVRSVSPSNAVLGLTLKASNTTGVVTQDAVAALLFNSMDDEQGSSESGRSRQPTVQAPDASSSCQVSPRVNASATQSGTAADRIQSTGGRNESSQGRPYSTPSSSEIVIPPEACSREFHRELSALSKLTGHPNVVALEGIVLSPLCLVIEKLDYSLGDALDDSDWQFKFDLKMRLQLLRDISAGLDHMHKHLFIHRDLKTHNILVKDNVVGTMRADQFSAKMLTNSNFIAAKISDLGTSVCLRDRDELLTTACGTSGYTAPEIFYPGEYALPADVFAFAVVGWGLFSQKHLSNPLTGLDARMSAMKLLVGTRPEFGPEHPVLVQEVVSRCWSTESHQRPTISEVLSVLSDIDLSNNKLYDKIYSQSVLKVVAPVRRRSMDRVPDGTRDLQTSTLQAVNQPTQLSPRALEIGDPSSGTNGTANSSLQSMAANLGSSADNLLTLSLETARSVGSAGSSASSTPLGVSVMSRKYGGRRSLDKLSEFQNAGGTATTRSVISSTTKLPSAGSSNDGSSLSTGAAIVSNTHSSAATAAAEFIAANTGSGTTTATRRGSFTGQAGLTKLLSTR